MDDEAARQCVVACARQWIGTPFVDLARVKGVGCDCAQLLAASYEGAGVLPHVDTGFYAPQFMLHSRDERLASFVMRYAKETDAERVGAGDVVLYQVGRSYSHAAIVVDWPNEIIHAHKLSRKVVAMRGDVADLEGRATRFFRSGGRAWLGYSGRIGPTTRRLKRSPCGFPHLCKARRSRSAVAKRAGRRS